MNSNNFFKNKTVTLMGLGSYKTGSGVVAAHFLAPRVKKLIVTDLKSADHLAPQIKALKKYKNIEWRLGGHKESDFTNVDWVVANPDVPASSEWLALARKHNIPVDNDVTLFLQMHGVEEVLGVTGTRGKTTTTTLLYEMVKRFDKQAFLAGNTGTSPLLKKEWLDPARPAVLELSSFLLHHFEAHRFSPHIAVFTNLYPDHLNKYGSMAHYQKDKENIFVYQTGQDYVIVNADTKALNVKKALSKTSSHKLYFSTKGSVAEGAFTKSGWVMWAHAGEQEKIMPLKEWGLVGAHNTANLLAATAAAKAYGVPTKHIRNAAKNFKGVPYRLELIRSNNGVRWYNDSTATSPEGAIAALSSFPAKKIILISGGNSKGLSLTNLNKHIKKSVRVLIKIPGNASALLPKGIEVKDLKEAVLTAAYHAKKGDVILLSPGLTWLPTINEFKRGDLFKKLVKKLH